MYVTELDSFIKKFCQLWKAGLTAHLDLDAHAGKAWVGIRAQLGDTPLPVHQHVHHPFPPQPPRRGPAYQRRQARRRQAAQAAAAADQATHVEAEHAEKADNTEAGQVDKATAEIVVKPLDEAGNAFNNSDVAVEDVGRVNVKVTDEVCPDEEYLSCLEKNKKKCSIQLVPMDQYNIEVFRDNVEKYFEERRDIIERVVSCRVEKSGRSVRLETILKRQLWINFFSEPVENYGDLPGVKRVVHDCKDLANCDRI